MNKVLQSAGRVIRTQEDTGIILLLDERFAGKITGICFLLSGLTGETVL